MKKLIALVLILMLIVSALPALADKNEDKIKTEQFIKYLMDTSGGGLTEQPYIGHPRYYEETGTEHTKTWKNLQVNDGEFLIVGGVVVNNVPDGVYKAFAPGIHTVKVTDGFVAIVDGVWATGEFSFRVTQALTYNWAHGLIDIGPLVYPELMSAD